MSRLARAIVEESHLAQNACAVVVNAFSAKLSILLEREDSAQGEPRQIVGVLPPDVLLDESDMGADAPLDAATDQPSSRLINDSWVAAIAGREDAPADEPSKRLFELLFFANGGVGRAVGSLSHDFSADDAYWPSMPDTALMAWAHSSADLHQSLVGDVTAVTGPVDLHLDLRFGLLLRGWSMARRSLPRL